MDAQEDKEDDCVHVLVCCQLIAASIVLAEDALFVASVSVKAAPSHPALLMFLMWPLNSVLASTAYRIACYCLLLLTLC